MDWLESCVFCGVRAGGGASNNEYNNGNSVFYAVHA
jgi:hypothetical protein